MIISLLEMLELPNLDHMTNLQYNLNHEIKFYWWRHGDKLWRHNLFFQNTIISRRPRVAIFADIIKIVIMFY